MTITHYLLYFVYFSYFSCISLRIYSWIHRITVALFSFVPDQIKKYCMSYIHELVRDNSILPVAVTAVIYYCVSSPLEILKLFESSGVII